MPDAGPSYLVYRELAEIYDHRGENQLRDRFLVLATDAAFETGQPAEADQLRRRLLQRNPHHLLKPFPSYPEALRSTDVQTYLKDLRQGYPPGTAAALLESLRSGKEKPAGKPQPQKDSQLDLHLPLDEPEASPAPFWLFDEEEKKPKPPSPPPRPAPAPTRITSPPVKGPALPLKRSSNSQPAAPVVPFRPVAPKRAAAAAHTQRPNDPVDGEGTTGSWVAMILAVLIGTIGLALLLYSFARPFLPANWPH